MSHHRHSFTISEVEYLRKQLLQFYDKNKRDLPWRRLASTIENDSDRAYSVWVSEIMLQQTQVATVIDYYKKWMKKWPTIEELAKANINYSFPLKNGVKTSDWQCLVEVKQLFQEVNEMWSGLGYYSRGRRLLEGAKKITSASGEMPKTSKDLVKEVPGVGRYTAGAIASIAYKEATGVVDGNVVRVLSRLLQIGPESSQQATTDLFWETANAIVDSGRPGDFNQAMMELGATICTPKNPNCCKCPLRKLCRAYGRTEVLKSKKQKNISDKKQIEELKTSDIEDVPDCKFCLPKDEPFDESLGVLNYPRKKKKKAAREEKFLAVLVQYKNKFLMQQRPEKGLLAGLWEIPMVSMENQDVRSMKKDKELIITYIKDEYEIILDDKCFLSIGDVTHIFSHIHHTYHVYHVTISDDSCNENHWKTSTWMAEDDVMTKSAVSTGIKKIFKLLASSQNKMQAAKRKRSNNNIIPDKNQRTLESLFSKKKVKKENAS